MRASKPASKQISRVRRTVPRGLSRLPVLLSRAVYVSPDSYVDRRKRENGDYSLPNFSNFLQVSGGRSFRARAQGRGSRGSMDTGQQN